MDVIKASAPSNIALIKYMGKTDARDNRPANASLSYTLENLRTFVTIEEGGDGERDRWEPLAGHRLMQLSEAGREKFLKHFARLKTAWNVDGAFTVRSANTFPSDCGLASSASSFAALTRATYDLARARRGITVDDETLAGLSRGGSGSSCRSFFTPWSVWSGERAGPAAIDLRLAHAVIVVEDAIKTVSSSEAHRRVLTSDLFSGRPARADRRLAELESSLRAGDWRQSFELCWAEFWDMHALFETSRPSFGYMSAGTFKALERARTIWRETGDGPLVTMDAGPNVHFLLRTDQIAAAAGWLDGFNAITSWS